MTNPKPTKPTEPWLKRNKLDFDKERAKSSAMPALYALGGAVAGGGLAYVIPPFNSALGGLACIFAGIYSDKFWLATAGAAMLTSTAHISFSGSGLRTSEGGGQDLKSMIEDKKERLIAFGKAFAGKFIPVKEETKEGLSGLGDPHMLLDDIERSVEASALEYQGTARILPAPPGTLPTRPGLPGNAPNNFHRY